ncbi:MAG: hypothetical protein ACK4YP_03145 [Myxococcota bacterium]
MIGRFFLPEAPAARLGLLRLGLGAYVLQDLIRVRRPVIALADGDPSLWDPVGVTTLLSGPLDHATWAFTHDLTLVVGVLFTLGAFWRVTGPLFAGLLLFVWTYRVSWQMIYHVHHLTMLHVLVVAMAPAAAAVSVDAAFGGRWRWLTSAPAGRGTSWQYGWPIQLVCIVTTLCYMLAGVAKIQLSGWESWAGGQNLLDQVAYDGVYKAVLGPEKDAPPELIGFAYRHPWILAPMATGALVLEAFAPVALLHRRIGQAWSIGAVGMHWGIHAFMNLVFPYPISGMAFLSFFPLEKLLPRAWREEPQAAPEEAEEGGEAA